MDSVLSAVSESLTSAEVDVALALAVVDGSSASEVTALGTIAVGTASPDVTSVDAMLVGKALVESALTDVGKAVDKALLSDVTIGVEETAMGSVTFVTLVLVAPADALVSDAGIAEAVSTDDDEVSTGSEVAALRSVEVALASMTVAGSVASEALSFVVAVGLLLVAAIVEGASSAGREVATGDVAEELVVVSPSSDADVRLGDSVSEATAPL